MICQICSASVPRTRIPVVEVDGRGAVTGDQPDLVADPEPVVRLQAVITLGRIDENGTVSLPDLELPTPRPAPSVSDLRREFGFQWRIIRGLGVMARAIGLVGHILEEIDDPMGVEIWQRVEREAGGPRKE